MNIEERLERVIDDVLKTSDRQWSQFSEWGELGADSLDTINLLMSIEEEFNITISEQDALEINTPKDALNYLKKVLP